MGISQKDIKLLWGRAASRCAFPDCRVQLTQDSANSSRDIAIGEQAHIVAKEKGGPRGESVLSIEERDLYSNLILLCPTHHKMIDKKPEDFPVERLHHIKINHELWVQEKLSSTTDLREDAKNIIYKDVIDSAVELCHLSDWESWTQNPLSEPPSWVGKIADDIGEFRTKIACVDWPRAYPAVECSLISLGILLFEALKIFKEYQEEEIQEDGSYFYKGIKFYKLEHHPPQKYSQLLQEFLLWVEDCHLLIFEATKSANWFRDAVRVDIDPLFFAREGKFWLHPHSVGEPGSRGIEDPCITPTYTPQEITELLNSPPDELPCLKLYHSRKPASD